MIEDNLLKQGIEHGANYTVGNLEHGHEKLRYLRAGALVCKFDGLDAALDYITTSMPIPKRDGSSSTKGHGSGGNFYHFTSYDKALKVFRHNPESIANYDETELRIKDVNESGNIVEYNVQGDYIDMGRYMEGIPESFGTLYNGNARNRRVRVLIDTNQVHYIDQKDVNHRSERILRLVDALEVGGARCELTAIDSNYCGHTEIVIKKYEEPLAINDLAVTTHSDWKRRIIFRVNEYSPTWGGGYGMPFDFARAAEPKDLESENVNELTIVIVGSMQNNINNNFDKLERLLVWELSKPIPEVSAIKIGEDGVFFHENGSRDSQDIRREGLAILNER